MLPVALTASPEHVLATGRHKPHPSILRASCRVSEPPARMHATSRLVALLSFVLSLSLILTKKRKNYRNSVSKSWVAPNRNRHAARQRSHHLSYACDPAMSYRLISICTVSSPTQVPCILFFYICTKKPRRLVRATCGAARRGSRIAR